MIKQFHAKITYFLQEGQDNLLECLEAAFQAAHNHGIDKIVIFTAKGLGVVRALDEFCSKSKFAKIKLIAVTFPVGKPFTDAERRPLQIEISDELRDRFRQNGIPILRAHMPFDPITPLHRNRGVLGQDLSLVESALGVFGGSMSLCVQAIMIACDAGEIDRGEHVVALTSDTAIVAQAAPTRYLLSELAIREILCKPAVYNIGRGEKADEIGTLNGEPMPEGKVLEGQTAPQKDDEEAKNKTLPE